VIALRKVVRASAVSVAIVLLAACAASRQPFIPGVAPGELIHRHSGFVFPARIGSFGRVTGRQYDARGQDISIGYNGDIPSVVTIYVYPANERDLESSLTAQSAEILTSYPGARITGRRTVQVTPSDINAESVTFTFSTLFMGKEQPLHSELVLARHGDNFIKYRITYPVAIADLAGEDSSRFLQRFAWP
jgi:hypothetical protein